jgi:hypothetical protein
VPGTSPQIDDDAGDEDGRFRLHAVAPPGDAAPRAVQSAAAVATATIRAFRDLERRRRDGELTPAEFEHRRRALIDAS